VALHGSTTTIIRRGGDDDEGGPGEGCEETTGEKGQLEVVPRGKRCIWNCLAKLRGVPMHFQLESNFGNGLCAHGPYPMFLFRISTPRSFFFLQTFSFALLVLC
jgi:hypothetical protein